MGCTHMQTNIECRITQKCNRNTTQVCEYTSAQKLRKYEADIITNIKKFVRKFQPHYSAFAKRIEAGSKTGFLIKKQRVLKHSRNNRVNTVHLF